MNKPSVYFGFNISQTDCDRIGIRIYTSASRLVRETAFTGGEMTYFINNRFIAYDTAKYLSGLSNGVYFYFLYAVKGGVETRSKIDKIIILK